MLPPFANGLRISTSTTTKKEDIPHGNNSSVWKIEFFSVEICIHDESFTPDPKNRRKETAMENQNSALKNEPLLRGPIYIEAWKVEKERILLVNSQTVVSKMFFAGSSLF